MSRLRIPIRMPLQRLLALLAWTCACAAQAQAPDASEAQVKAAFTYNLAKFVEWPASSFASPQAPVRLCVAGRGVVPNMLAELEGKTVQGRELRVLLVGGAVDHGSCHLLFLARGAEVPIADILRHVKDASVLTVSDAGGFVEQGGMIELIPGEGRLQFSVNLNSARRANLRLSANLLKLARTRVGEPN